MLLRRGVWWKSHIGIFQLGPAGVAQPACERVHTVTFPAPSSRHRFDSDYVRACLKVADVQLGLGGLLGTLALAHQSRSALKSVWWSEDESLVPPGVHLAPIQWTSLLAISARKPPPPVQSVVCEMCGRFVLTGTAGAHGCKGVCLNC